MEAEAAFDTFIAPGNSGSAGVFPAEVTGCTAPYTGRGDNPP